MNSINRKKTFSGFIGQASKRLFTTTAITAVGFLYMTGNAKAANDWTDHVVTGGGGSININTATPDTTNITQTGHRVKVSGDGDIKAGWTVNVHQDNASAQYILFDTEADPTHIRGNLNANGEIYIFDQNGVIFGADSNVNVGSIVASTGMLSSTDEDLDAGLIKINSDSETDGSIVNEGTVTVAEAGVAAFVSPNITNSGVINAKMATVVMAAGEMVTLDMYGDGLVEVAVDGELADGLIRNSGEINANGGNVIITASIAKEAVDNVINMTGIVDVSSATVKGGKIILSGGSKGRVRVKGKLKANGKSGQDAGSVNITGQNIKVTNSGRIKANAEDGAAAGEINVIATTALTINGKLSAQGLVDTGDIETSAPSTTFGANASILATRKWLLDPTDITIDNPLAALIEGQLAVGDMTVQTPLAGGDAGNIDVNTVVDWSSTNTFSLIANNDINFNNGGGVNSIDDGNFEADAGGSIRLKAGNSGISAWKGDITLTSADEFTLTDGVILTHKGNILIDNGQSFEALANSLIAGSGNIEINQNKDSGGVVTVANPTIQNAIDAIFNLGTGTNTVNVGAGIWDESVIANINNLALKGANAGTDGNDPRVAETVINSTTTGVLVAADNVTVDGFAIDTANTYASIGVDIQGADGTNVINNIITNTGRHAVKFVDATDTNISYNKIDRVGNDGISGRDSSDIDIYKNSIHSTSADGIAIADSSDINIHSNTITKTDGDGVEIFRSSDVTIDGNDIDLLGGNTALNSEGVEAINVENLTVTNNTISNVDQNGVRALHATGDTNISNNIIQDIGENGIAVEDFVSALIADNDISVVGSDGIKVEDGTSVDVSGNIIGHTGDDGIDIDDTDVVIVRDNATSLTEDAGITIYGGEYAGVFDNRILLAGSDGIRIEEIYNHGEDAELFGDENYGYGWAVNVSGNEVAMVGEDGIHIGDSGPTKVVQNDVFMAGMGSDLEDVIADINDFADGSFTPEPPIVAPQPLLLALEEIDNFTWEWGDDSGINIHDIEGAHNSPNGWAVDVRGNTVKWTGGHGIEVEDSDRTRIKNNNVQYAGIDETTFVGQHSMLSTLNSGPFVSEGRRDLWASEGSMVDVLESYFGTNEPSEDAYVNIEDIAFDSHDGIHVEDIYNEYGNGLFALKIKGNTVKYTGDDGIDVDGAGRTLIAKNKVRDAGYGAIEEPEDYGSGDYDGADGIHVSNVMVETYDRPVVRAAGLEDDEEAYNYEPDRNYALIIRDNDVRRTADDGIEVVGAGLADMPPPFAITTRDEGYFSTTDRVLIAENTVRKSGYFYAEERIEEQGLEHGYNNVGPDGYGHDGIHVRDIAGTTSEGSIYNLAYAGGVEEGEGGDDAHNHGTFAGYAVDIINNDVRKTGDDGIEVIDSASTLILGNTVRKAGVAEGRKKLSKRNKDGGSEYNNTDGADYYGADGIHVRNVGGENNIYAAGIDSGRNYEPYAVAIVDNDVRKTADDGIEVVGEMDDEYGDHASMDEYDDYGSMTSGTGRTLILHNVVRDAGTSGNHGYFSYSSYDNRGDSGSEENSYGYRGSYDGYGGDGIHVRGINSYGDAYAVQIIDNDVRRTGDDGIEVIGMDDEYGDNYYDYRGTSSGRVLIEGNMVRNAGLSGGSYYYDSNRNYGYDEEGYFNVSHSSEHMDYFGNAGNDGYGADGIHVRGIRSDNGGPTWFASTQVQPSSGELDGYYTGYAVDIIGNDVRRTADDGIEVLNSDSTYIAENEVRNAGILSESHYNDYSYHSSSFDGTYNTDSSENGEFGYWSGSSNEKGNYTGGDGIHVENVGTNGDFIGDRLAGGIETDDGFQEYAVVIADNDVRKSSDDGIEVLNSGRTRIDTNNVKNSGTASFSGYESYESSLYEGEGESSSSSSSEHSGNSYGASARDGRGSDGIHVGGVYANEVEHDGHEATRVSNDLYHQYSVEIVGNTVDKSGDDGIQVINSGDTLIGGYGEGEGNTVSRSGIATSYGDEDSHNMDMVASITDDYDSESNSHEYGGTGEIDSTGGDGINVSRDRLGKGGFKPRPTFRVSDMSEGEEYTYPTYVDIIGNDVSDSADDGIEVIGGSNRPSPYTTNVLVDANHVEESGDNGIALITGSIFEGKGERDERSISSVSLMSVPGPAMNSETTGNEVINSGTNGLLIGGANHDQVVVSGNTFTDFDIGAHFQSGEIDLTGDGNNFNGGRIGMRFAPAETMMDHYYDIRDLEEEAPTFADMSLVGNTIGETTFNGQSTFFVELDNGAFFAPGTPTLLSANDATFVGTPFGTFTPAVDYAGGFPADVLAYLESRFFHFNDDGTLGLFFFQPAGIDQEDVFNTFDPLSDGLSGLNVTLLGLPNIPGAPAGAPAGGSTSPSALNSIETAAGGEGTSPEDLNDIETAAGGEESTCWGDALNTAGSGQATTFSYGGSAEELLNGEASCSNTDI